MSDNKAPVRVWLCTAINYGGRSSVRYAASPVTKLPPPLDAIPQEPLYISAAALRELVEKWEKLNEKLHLQYPHDYAGYYYDAAQELEQLLEAD